LWRGDKGSAEFTTRPDVLDIVVFLKLFDKGENLGRSFWFGCRCRIFRFVDEATCGRDQILGSEGFIHSIKAVGWTDDFGGIFAGRTDVVGPGIEGGFQNVIRVSVFQKKDALSSEHPGNGVGAGEIAFVFGEEMADFCRSPVFIIGLGFDHESGASGGISLVGDLLDGAAPFEFTGAFLDGPVDFVHRHGFGPSGDDGGAEPGVEIGVTPEEVGGDGDLFGELGEEGSPFDVGGALGALDFGPVTMTCHIRERLR